MKALAGWLARTGFLYLLLFAAIAFAVLARPRIEAEIGGTDWRAEAMGAEEVRRTLAQERARTLQELERRGEEARTAPRAAIERRMRAARTERDAIARRLEAGSGPFDAIRPSRIVERKRDELRLAALEQELALLAEASNLDAARRMRARYAAIPTRASIADARRTCRVWTRRLAAFEADNPVRREVRAYLGRRETLRQGKARECGKLRRWTTQRGRGLAARKAFDEAQKNYEATRDAVTRRIPDPTSDLAQRTMRDIAIRALVALLIVLAAPFVIRTLFYYVLAPIAQRRRAIRLTSRAGGPVRPGASAPSVSVTLKEGEELLVRQSFLQTRPANASFATRWLLDWRSPLTSLASGMAFLTRVTGEGATLGLSPRDNPFDEVARIDLDDAALVLQPRALAGLVQRRDALITITSRWRFGLHAWLTFQFRYLVFGGTGTLIVKGGRGVRVERADAGRVFSQDQLVGFSAHTAYTVARTETFAPYLFGREPLLRDRVSDTGQGSAGGVLVIEEAPMAGRRKGVRGGLEGAFDALLKAFGV